MHQISQRKKNHEQIHVTAIKTDESLVVLQSQSQKQTFHFYETFFSTRQMDAFRSVA